MYGACGSGSHDLRVGRRLLAATVTFRSTPHTKKDTTRDCCRAPHLHHILCSAHTNTCATARSVTFIHSYIHTFIHSYIHTFIHPYIHTSIHSYIHTFIHSHIHTFTQRGASGASHSRAQRVTHVFIWSTCLHRSHVDHFFW